MGETSVYSIRTVWTVFEHFINEHGTNDRCEKESVLPNFLKELNRQVNLLACSPWRQWADSGTGHFPFYTTINSNIILLNETFKEFVTKKFERLLTDRIRKNEDTFFLLTKRYESLQKINSWPQYHELSLSWSSDSSSIFCRILLI